MVKEYQAISFVLLLWYLFKLFTCAKSSRFCGLVLVLREGFPQHQKKNNEKSMDFAEKRWVSVINELAVFFV